jgi:predicted HicB family RNase H-like nuclease
MDEITLIIKKVPKSLRQELKIAAAKEGKSMQEIIIMLIKNYVKKA